jgi:uncharacterized protein involved in exopolysaccharide biosynthesis
MWCTNRLLLILLCGAGCRTAPPPAADTDQARIRDLEARIALLEERAKATAPDDEILALEVERAGLVLTYAPGHPTLVKVDLEIDALQRSRAEEAVARRERMLRQLDAQRAQALVTYSADHDTVRRLDAQIAFLRAGQG